MTDTPQWKLDRKNPTPYMRPGRGEYRAFTEDWLARMTEHKTRVEVHLSTALDPNSPWDSWELSGEPAEAFNRVKKHLAFRRAHKTLQSGCYCITVPGTDRKHSFEVT